jgi:hypothetical protein
MRNVLTVVRLPLACRMRMKAGTALALLLAAGPCLGQDILGPDFSPARTSFVCIAAETGGALLCSGAAAGLGYGLNLLLPGLRPNASANLALYVGIEIVRYLPYAMVPPSAAGGADWVGRSLDYPGTLWHAVVGSVVIGGPYAVIGSGLLSVSDELPSPLEFWAVYAGLSSVGAVAGYEVGKLFGPQPLDLGAIPANFDPHSVGMRPVQSSSGDCVTALDFRLISARF